MTATPSLLHPRPYHIFSVPAVLVKFSLPYGVHVLTFTLRLTMSSLITLIGRRGVVSVQVLLLQETLTSAEEEDVIWEVP